MWKVRSNRLVIYVWGYVICKVNILSFENKGVKCIVFVIKEYKDGGGRCIV